MTHKTIFRLHVAEDIAYSIIGLFCFIRWSLYHEFQGDPWWIAIHLFIALCVGRSIIRLWVCAKDPDEYLRINGVSHD